MNIYLDLFLTFAKIGLFTFGGGYAMISVIDHQCVSRKKWITHEEMAQMTVLAESTPGPIAINCATYTGFQRAGFWGALAATIGMILPSFVIIYLISIFLDRFLEIQWIANAFRGIKVAVGVLILDAALRMLKKAKKRPLSLAILGCSAVAMLLINFFSWNFSTISLLLIAAAVSLTVYLVSAKKGGGRK